MRGMSGMSGVCLFVRVFVYVCVYLCVRVYLGVCMCARVCVGCGGGRGATNKQLGLTMF